MSQRTALDVARQFENERLEMIRKLEAAQADVEAAQANLDAAKRTARVVYARALKAGWTSQQLAKMGWRKPRPQRARKRPTAGAPTPAPPAPEVSVEVSPAP